MNTPLRKLATVVIVMFAALMLSATWVQYVKAPSLNADGRNVRTIYREYGNYRGPIVVGGEQIAWSTPVSDSFGYQRKYSNGALYSAVTGFYSVVYGRTGIEATNNTVLNGSADSLFLARLQDLVTGKQQRGATVELTIDPAVQKAAGDALGGQKGAVVALDPRTGAILAMVTSPGFDPNALARHDISAVNSTYQTLLNDPNGPLVNRAIAGDTYAPGSIFKLVTAAAALESGRYQPATMLQAPRELSLPLTSAKIQNFGGESCSSTGKLSLADSLRISCNTSFAQLGLDLGDKVLRNQARAFGFDQTLHIPLKVTASHFPESLDAPQTAISAIGQFEDRVTPLQVAMIASAIANRGVLMTPYLVATERSSDLAVISKTEPSEFGRPISAATAGQLRDMMLAAVRNGTGRAAAISGVDVAGKTGTAQTSQQAPDAWFTAFAPASDPQVVVAVVVEHGGSLGSEATGGQVAAPIARAVIKAVLKR